MLETLAKLSNILAGANCAVCKLEANCHLYHSHLFLRLEDLSQQRGKQLTLSKIYRSLFYQFNLCFKLIFSLA